ncbi:ABC transporter permease [Candidatus Methanocrinis natronophilus]|uniref:ABC transporter permease n=1 Tax=Candidatus Methanocrinis natronophilus TaxID=3033396 RepID=A0ABT5XB56_9EURY|nr:ABC transporter permease [Candidatus Methanocrinis natronophilus]MDF0591954.1 ABC transporter permease [Candidatus Methanocrinis natronophilus]
MTVSDLKVKYQSSVLGFLWSLLNPLLMMLVLYFVFSNVFAFEDDSFALYLLIGIVGWRFLANGTMTSISAIVGRPSLVTKVYVPRQILVLSTVLSSFASSILEFSVLVPLLIFFGVNLSMNVLLFPIIHLAFLVLVYGTSLILSSLYVYYRDLNQIWDVLLQAGFFLSPIVYPISIVPEKYLAAYMMNPVTVTIEIYRAVLLYATTPSLADLAFVVAAAAGVLIAGTAIFGRLERRFAEEI